MEAIAMPADFKYKDIYFMGRPTHDKHSSFYAKHPPMPPGRWAKIFAPFDALKWFDERIAEKEILYTDRQMTGEDELRELDRKLEILKNLAGNSRMAKKNKVQATVTYYVPCTDKNSEAYGCMGRYNQLSGIVRKVDTDLCRIIRIDNTEISLDDISAIEADSIFEKHPAI